MEEGNDKISFTFLKGNFDDCVEEDGLDSVQCRQGGNGPQTSSITWELVRNTDFQVPPRTY